MNARVHAFVSGRVQGVFFRDFTMNSARSLGLKGLARNMSDGRVEVIAEGDRDALMKLAERLKKGSTYARVDKVDVRWEEFMGEFQDFRIIY
jgi:acylphosphatase